MNNPDLYHILPQAEQLHADGSLEQAAELYRRALAITPTLSRTAYNLGLILLELQDYPGAEAAFNDCLATEPDLLEARLNHAFSLQEQGRITEAQSRYQAIAMTYPDCIEARFNLACLQLLQGNFTDGFIGYELRFTTNDPVIDRHNQIPVWNGSLQTGLRLLVHAEQGYGDTIQMLRYLPLLAEQGVLIVLELPTPLFPLCNGIPHITCIERGWPLPPVDCRLPIMSLPRAMRTDIETIPAAAYLRADDKLSRKWQSRLSDTTAIRVGLAWAGRLDLPVNRKRSCPSAFLQPLLDTSNASFICLQTVIPEGFALNHPQLFDVSAELTDFNQTAALIANLDLVITIDSAVAHLAGALGVPTWLMLPAVPDWRWLLERDDSPWYPSLRIFRQGKPGEWKPVITEIQKRLSAMTHSSKTPATAWYRLGTTQLKKTRFNEAANSFHHAIALEPNLAPAWHNLAHAYQKQQQHKEALSCYHRALQHCPNDPCSLNNIGVLLREMGRLDESQRALEQLVTTHPNDGDGHWNLSITLLTTGNYLKGWQEYEWRFRRTLPVPIFDPGTPRWHGEPLEGKTILLCCEQAYGDSIQFVRFAAILSDWGATVLLRCPDNSLAGLLATAPGVCQTLTADDTVPTHDFWSPLLSVPLHLRTSQASIPPCPYLFAETPAEQIQMLDSKLKIGLVWSGRNTDPQRACPVKLLAPLARFTGKAAFFSLQLNSPVDDLTQLKRQLGITDLAPLLTDFKATATIMQQLDLVISIDSAPAHLAGALGRETWLLLHYAPDWRWGQKRTDSDWYPSMRIFQQPEAGAWQPAIEQLLSALDERLAGAVNSIPTATAEELLELGDHRREQEQWSAALHLYQRASRLEPDNYLAWLCSGGCQIFLNRPELAAGQFRKAIRLRPDEPDAHINLGLVLLSSNDLSEGWKEFSWRCHAIRQQLPPIPLLPLITPGQTLNGQTVLIHTEQGYGDLLQFARYLPLLAETGLRIIISTPPAMLRLIAKLCGVFQAILHGELLPDADYQLPLLSVPERLSLLVQNIPVPGAYLAPDSDLTMAWQQRLSPDNRLKVGVVWRGNNLGKSGYQRALSAELLAPLSHIPDITLYCLQLNATANELSYLPGIIDLTPDFTDFADTAAVMLNLDLIISVDTATAHLAGSLGVRCWVPLLFSPDWRWHPLREQTSRWYPSITTFRQPIPGRWEPTIEQIAAALKGEALLHKGHCLGRVGDTEAAIEAFSEAAALPGGNAPALLNLGSHLRAEGKAHQARQALQQAIEADPDYPEAWQNLALAHQDLGELTDAYICLKRAFNLRPGYATARWNLGLLQLLLGDYQQGFRNFEARFTKIGAVALLHTGIPAWDGSALTGKSILIHAEQGYGDTIQFIRFIPQLLEAGAQVILEIQDRSLLKLCRSLQKDIQVIVRGDTVPVVDLQAPLLSLPFLLGSTIETIPRKIPYLSADKDKIGLWKSRLPTNTLRKIGICWKGRSTPDPRRSIPFIELAPLFEQSGICWVSLQMERDDSAQLPEGIVDLTGEIRDFSDTAALMSCLDLIISIDSSVTHLAGALGLHCIVLLPFAADWRWTHNKDRTPWYPSLQLFRQQAPGEWKLAIDSLTNSLTQLPPAEVSSG